MTFTGPILWTPKAVSEGLNTRQIDENTVLDPASIPAASLPRPRAIAAKNR
jgi:hypothetical protein